MIWSIFLVFILSLLLIDLVVLNKTNEVISNKKAAQQTLFWVLVAFSFSFVLFYIYKNDFIANPTKITPITAVSKYISGYLIELSLSVDNLFVIAMIFKSYNVPLHLQHRSLFWGIIGAIVLRGLAIGLGVILISKISWMAYIFGGFLIITAFRMITQKEEDTLESEEKNKSKLHKLIPFSQNFDGDKFFTKENGKRLATPLFGALLMIEFSDLVFALDSIPAIIAITTDPFIVFSSNIFAILGLRSMYFFLANMLKKFKYLEYSVFAILLFVGLKLIAMHHFEVPEWFSLSFIGLSL
ncbi:MAG TPA: TerC/Alx family metal homeostasis membrane protein, partial [Saprospiraceae bacterium]|nr:TerC/Alx family metal homeostasis membrane protein [Saprospiraceae bacterium]